MSPNIKFIKENAVMNDDLKKTKAELTESELTQVTGGSFLDQPNSGSPADGESVIADETTITEPKKSGMAWW